MSKFATTSCSQCGASTGPGDSGHSSCATHKSQPNHTHWTETGDGKATVECRFDFDVYGDIEVLQVYLDGEGKDIRNALTESQLIDLEAECHAAAAADYKDEVQA